MSVGLLVGLVLRGESGRRRHVATWVGWLVGASASRVVVLVVWLASALVGTLVGVEAAPNLPLLIELARELKAELAL